MDHTKNPYQTPGVSLDSEADRGEIDQTSVFSAKGRFTRMSYLAWAVTFVFLVAIVVGGVFGAFTFAAGESTATLANVIISIPITVLAIVFAIRRLHDMNASGWWALIALVPLVNLILSIVLAAKHGSPGANAYGPPRPTTSGERIAGVIGIIMFVLIPIAILMAIAIPAYNGYIQEARLLNGG